MTPSMIFWTLDFLDWIREQLAEHWPEAKLRGGEMDIDPEPYRIRLRDRGKQYWMFLSPEAIRGAGLAEVTSLLDEADWIRTIQETGGLSVGLHDSSEKRPVLIPWPALGPEIKADAPQ